MQHALDLKAAKRLHFVDRGKGSCATARYGNIFEKMFSKKYYPQDAYMQTVELPCVRDPEEHELKLYRR
jgi:hypothetical protein